MNYIKSILYSVVAIMCVATFTSCSDDLDSKELYAFIRGELKPINATFRNTVEGGVELVDSDFEIQITRSTQCGVVINYGVDVSLVESYNAENGTSFSTLSANAVADLSATIEAEGISVNCTLQLDHSVLNDGEEYLIPIVLKSINSEDKGISISSNAKTIYFVVTNMISNISDVIELDGDIIDRTSWSITSLGVDINIDYLLDSDPSSYWSVLMDDPDPAFLIDLGVEKNLKGLKFLPAARNGYTYNAKIVNVETSVDGGIWSTQGSSYNTFKTPGSYSEIAVDNYVVFIQPVVAKFIRITVLKTQDSHAGQACIAEFDAIE